jgi:hypothetical protein
MVGNDDNGKAGSDSPRSRAKQHHLWEVHIGKLRAALSVGLEQADRGELLDGPQVVEELRELLRRRRG